ncbi:MAG: ABC transporter substrate-binding protein [Hyphomicrobiaceae bacterium]
MRRRLSLPALAMALTLLLLLPSGAQADTSKIASPLEPPSLAQAVAAGRLPPVAKRLPSEPLVVRMEAEGKTTGRYGGHLDMLLGKQNDTRLVAIYSYARLVCYRPDFTIVPDILRKLEITDNRVFTLHLRRGHRWSDGHPFTAEDFRYYWQDVANNIELAPYGPPRPMLVDGKPPRFEIIDPVTIRFTWEKPNHDFVSWLAGPSPPPIYRPAHYLKAFHWRYGDRDKITEMLKAQRRRNWADLHASRDRPDRGDNPDLPTLDPWIATVKPPADRYVFVRNPYYHRLDSAGHQLPYIDQLVVSLSSVDVIPAKTAAGDSDLQARYIRFDHYTFLKRAAKRNGLKVLLWRNLKTAHTALLPNFNVEDAVWRKLVHDVRFRRALSLAVDRHEINQVIFFGLAHESGNTVMPGSPLFSPHLAKAWSGFDLAKANALLDEMGLVKRNSEGVRLLPDGRPMHIIVESAGESTEESDILQLIKDSWRKVGIKLYSRSSHRDVFRRRMLSGQAVMGIWPVTENGLAQPWMNPWRLAPTSRMQYQWPKWGRHFETDGKSGHAPDLPAAKQLVALYKAWHEATSRTAQERIWKQMLEINAEQVFTIGIVNGTLRPVVVAAHVRNVPEKGVFHWDPGAYFGIYKPDTFWIDDRARVSASGKVPPKAEPRQSLPRKGKRGTGGSE